MDSQAFGVGELAPVPGDESLGIGEHGLGDRVAALAERGAGFGDGGRCGLVAGDGGQAGPPGQGAGNGRSWAGGTPATFRSRLAFR